MRSKTLKLTHRELALVVKSLRLWYLSGEQEERVTTEDLVELMNRLTSRLGDMNYDARAAGEPLIDIEDIR